MKHSFARVRVVLLLVLVPQLVASQGILAQGPALQQGSKAQVVYRDPTVRPFEGRVIETWDDGFAIDVRGEWMPRRVEFAEVESLQRSLRVGTHAANGAWIGGVAVGIPAFALGYCFQIFNEGCAKDLRSGAAAGLIGAAAGSLVGAGIGLLISRYGPWEAVADVGGPGRSGALDRVSIDVLPHPDGRIGLGVSLAF